MAGFFGLFGSKTKYIDDPTPSNEQSSSTEEFYLSDDEAKSLGNREYIRKSMEKKKTTEKSSPAKSETQSSKSETRSVDSNMDIFRKMAKDLKK